jgi:hypothetical protein
MPQAHAQIKSILDSDEGLKELRKITQHIDHIDSKVDILSKEVKKFKIEVPQPSENIQTQETNQ